MVESRKKMKALAYDMVAKIFKPMVTSIMKKLVVMKKRSELIGDARKLADELAACTDTAKATELLKKLEATQDDIYEASKPLAFRERAKDEAEQFRYFMASTYGDMWSEIRGPKGELLGSFCSWFLCMAGVGWGGKCATAIASKRWETMLADPLATGQRWFCLCCPARYRPKYGMLVQLAIRNSQTGNIDYFYALSDVPDDEQDIKALHLESTYNPSSPEALFDALPEVLPAVTSMVRQATAEELKAGCDPTGVFKVTGIDALIQCPRWNWKQLYNFATTMKHD